MHIYQAGESRSGDKLPMGTIAPIASTERQPSALVDPGLEGEYGQPHELQGDSGMDGDRINGTSASSSTR